MRDVLAVIGAYALAVIALVLVLLRWGRQREAAEIADPWQRYYDRSRPRRLMTEWN